MSTNIVDWPEDLAWILPHLEPYAFKSLRHIQMAGDEVHSPPAVPQTRYKAEVDVSDPQLELLYSVSRSLLRARLKLMIP